VTYFSSGIVSVNAFFRLKTAMNFMICLKLKPLLLASVVMHCSYYHNDIEKKWKVCMLCVIIGYVVWIKH